MSFSMRKISFVHPGRLFIAAAILLIFFSGFILFEYHQARRDIFAMMTEQGYVLLDALTASGERSLLGFEEIQTQITKRLVGQARLIARIDEIRPLRRDELIQLASSLGFYRIHLIDDAGLCRISNSPLRETFLSKEGLELLAPLFHQSQDSVILGILARSHDGESGFEVAVRHPGGGAVMVSIEAGRLTALRREIGPGRLVQEIGLQPGVTYVALQDTVSVILASRQIRSLNRILSDPFLNGIWETKQRNARQIFFEDRRILEIVGPFIIGGERLGLFRIGFEMSYFRHITQNAKIRLVLFGIVLVAGAFFGMIFWVTSQNARLIQRAFDRFRTQSGEILEHLEDAVVATDGAGQITVFNQATEFLFRIPRNQAMGRSVAELANPCFRLLEETLNNGKARQEPDALCRIEDEERTLFLRTTILKTESGEIDAAILIATDLSEQRRLEWEVRQKEKLQVMGKLAAEVAHEIRNPINAIGMIAQRFRKEFRPSNDEAEYDTLVEAILKEVGRTNGIIQHFLQFARTRSPVFKTIEIQRFLREQAALFESSAKWKQVHLEVQSLDVAQLEIDPEQIKQVLLNLFQNALDACNPGGHISLSGVREDGQYVITIRDDGVGIPPEEQKNIFELYYTTKPGGTGLGLPVVNQIIQNHQGSVDFESTPGESAVFSVRLPLPEPGSSA